jgi:diacylglycerol kinase (ATP)
MCNNLIIVNQHARWGRSRHRIRRSQRILSQQGFPFSPVTTEHPGHACELARKACAQNVDTIIVLGGDGTVNEVVNGILNSECHHMPRSVSENPVVGPRASDFSTGKDGEAGDIGVYRRCSRTQSSRKTNRSKPDRILRPAPRLGIIPTGSSNDFSRSLGIPQRLRQACQTVVRGKTKQVDVGQAGQHYFCMASCVGLLADIAATSMDMRGLLGSIRYIAAALKVVKTMSRGWDMRIKADKLDRAREYAGLLVSNTERFGGLTMMPQAKPDDGLLDCLLVEMVSKREALALVPLALRQALERHPKVTRFQARSLSLSLDRPTRLCNDGEVYGESFQKIEYRLLPQKLAVIC